MSRPLLLLALVGLWPGIAATDEPSAGAGLRSLRADALVARWLSSDRRGRVPVEAEILRRGPSAAAALRRIGDAHRPADRAGAGRLLVRITTAWHRRKVPPGMVYVPAGALEVPRTRPPWGPSGKRRLVAAFYIDKTEVTVAAWRAWCDGFDPVREPQLRERLSRLVKGRDPRLPVTGMRWDDARRFSAHRGGRLPEAREFERALRGSGIATYPWGYEARRGRANLRGLGPGVLVAVGSHPRGASTFGVHDLVGNAAEWSATRIRVGRRGNYPLVLGGSFRDGPSEAHTWRGKDRMTARVDPSEGRDWLGFRVVRPVPALP